MKNQLCCAVSSIEGQMKKLILVSATLLAVAFSSGGAFAIPGSAVTLAQAHGAAAKIADAPGRAVKVRYGCGQRRYHRCHSCGSCGGYYTTSFATPCGGYSGCGCSGGCVGCGWTCGCGGWGWSSGGFLGGFFGW
jgi:hypothetical protein